MESINNAVNSDGPENFCLKEFEIEYKGEGMHYIGASFYAEKFRTIEKANTIEEAREKFKKYYPGAKLLSITEKKN